MRHIINDEEYQHCKVWLETFLMTLAQVKSLTVPEPHRNQPYPDRLHQKQIDDLEFAVSELTAEIERWEHQETAHHALTGESSQLAILTHLFVIYAKYDCSGVNCCS